MLAADSVVSVLGDLGDDPPGQVGIEPCHQARGGRTASMAAGQFKGRRSGTARRHSSPIAQSRSPKGFPADLVEVARRKLRYLNAAGDLGDSRSPPGNRLEALAGDRKGQHSIRINDHGSPRHPAQLHSFGSTCRTTMTFRSRSATSARFSIASRP
jgi:hypothetical protein